MRAVIAASAAAALATTGYAGYSQYISDQRVSQTIEVSVADSVELSPIEAEVAPETIEPIALAEVAPVAEPEPEIPLVPVAMTVTEIEPLTFSEKEPILCAFWAIQKFGETVGILDKSEHDIAAVAYPVPAPIWIASNLARIAEDSDV